MNKAIFIVVTLFSLPFFSSKIFGQEAKHVRRTLDGGISIIRETIDQNKELNFYRDWNKTAKLKSGIGEFVEFFPVTLSVPDKKIEVQGLQLDLEVKPQTASTEVRNSGLGFNIVNKNFLKRTVFIDKNDVGRLITGVQKEVIPELKNTYKKKSKEYVFKAKELFFSFFIMEKKARITIHVADYGPNGDESSNEQIEFWTESNVDDIPEFLEILKSLYSTMK